MFPGMDSLLAYVRAVFGKRQRLVASSEVLIDVLKFLDRFSIDAVEFSSRRLRSAVDANIRHLSVRDVHMAYIYYTESTTCWSVLMEAVIPAGEPVSQFAYGETKSRVRSLKDTSFITQCLALEHMLRALHCSRVDTVQFINCVIMKAAPGIISHYASTVHVRYLCFRGGNYGWGCDLASVCSSFESLAELGNVMCLSCDNEFTDAFRNFCAAKNIPFH